MPSHLRSLCGQRYRITVFFLAALAVARGEESVSAARPVAAITNEVLTNNPELAFYREEIAAAKAGVRIAGALSDPEISAQVGRKRSRDLTGVLAGEGTAWSVSVAQTFEWPGRLALRKAIANREVALAELGLSRFQAALALRAQTLAFGLFAAEGKAAAAAEVAERFRALKQTFLTRDAAGLTPLLETRVIEAQELALQRRSTEAMLAAKAAATELNQLRGLAPDTPVRTVAGELTLRSAPTLDELLAAARESHFDFRAKKLELEQQGFVVQLARNERRPAFTVSPYVSRESSDGRDTIVGVGLSVPLPVSGKARSGVDVAEARRRQAEAAVLVAQREMEREVIATAESFAAKREETARWAPNAVEKFREAAALADQHYRLGAVPIATYVELQTAYLDAVDALLDTKKEALEAGLRLQLLTGLNFNAVEIAP